ncbi:hypothetical protein RhiJN_17001 [Ceratobasidium sp. AG-Ba]|nr:hypothetical protein RhiJN_17001 [Ceratobasidium sp. AG-Ba]
MSVHRSLNHQLVSVAVEFEGSAVWLYGPPRAQLPAIPPDYKICMHESHAMASDEICYRVNTAAAYSAAERYDEPVVIFAKGGLRYQNHRVVISVGDPIDNTQTHLGIHFSHAVYTIERPTPWPVEEDHWRFRRVVMHDTHPLMSYYPIPRCGGPWCRSGWSRKTYRAENGEVVSWHELKSNNEWDKEDWGVEATFAAGSAVLYGVPKAHITDTDYLSQICVRVDLGRCEIVDVQHAYLNSKHDHEAVMLWRHDALDPSHRTTIEVRLVKTESAQTSVFAFKSIEYYETQEYSSPDRSVGYPEDIEIAHDNEQIVYHPGGRCLSYFLWWCTNWFDPWVWREEGPTESKLTYRSTVSSYRKTEDPSIELDFQGSAVYVYAAPKTFIKDPFASQHICINEICHVVDTEQAYLNAPVDMEMQSYEQREAASLPPILDEREMETRGNVTLSSIHPGYEPVLIWSMTGLDDQVSHKLRLALAALPSQDNAEMSIAKVIYTKVTYELGESRPDPPVPQPDPQYEGPVYPPYARKWFPRQPLPSLPSPSRPPAPMPPNMPSSDRPPPHSSMMPIIIVSLSLAFCVFLGLCFRVIDQREERRRLVDKRYSPYSRAWTQPQ